MMKNPDFDRVLLFIGHFIKIFTISLYKISILCYHISSMMFFTETSNSIESKGIIQ